MFSSGFQPEDNCLYIGRTNDLFVTEKNQVICTHKNDILILHTDDIEEITNQILNAFEFYQSWNVRILEAISADRRPAEILKIVNEVIHEPIYLLDSSQYAMALSEEFGPGQVNELWDQMLSQGTSNIDFLTRLDAEFPEHRTRRGLYYFTVPFVSQNSYNYNIFQKNQCIGICSMVELSKPLPQSVVDLFHIFCLDIELWFISHSQEKESMMLDAMLREVLIGSPVTEVFKRQFLLHFRSLKDSKSMLVLGSRVEQPMLISHMCRELNLMFPQAVAIIYQQYICMLINCRNQTLDAFLADLQPTLQRYGYFGSCSLEFTALEQISGRFQEALYAAQKTAAIPGRVTHFQEFALQYALDEVKKEMIVGLIHPEVQKLIDYDKKHHTEFSETLRVYLEHERSQSKTAAALNLHRNTLTYRLQRIRELLSVDLEDPDVRLHLQLSFRLR